MKVALLGLGVMGSGMAGQLLAHGHELSVYNRTAERAASLAQQGASAAATPRQAVAGAAAVITMVSDDRALRAIAEGPDGFLGVLERGTLVLQMGTVGLDTTIWLAEQVQAQGAELVDGPVLGSLAEARAGTLWVLAGADAEVLARAKPVLDSMARQVYSVGGIGQGTKLKLCFNLVTGGVLAALAEGVALLETLGIDPRLYLTILKDADLPMRVWGGRTALMAERDFAPRFSLENVSKDIRLALRLAAESGLTLPQGQATLATFERGAAAVGGDKDMAAALEGVLQGRTQKESHTTG